MHALRQIHRSLVPGGKLLDMHPVPPATRAEVSGHSLGDFDDAEFFDIVSTTEAGLDETVQAGLFSFETEVEFDWLERYDNAEELLEDLKTWEGLSVPGDLAKRIREAESPVDIWERVILRRFRRR